MKSNSETILKGIPICRGIAIGKPYVVSLSDFHIPDFLIPEERIEEEIARYQLALQKARNDISDLLKQAAKEDIAESVSLLDSQLHMMQDPLLTVEVENEIRKSQKNAEAAFHLIIANSQKKFESLDEFFKERFRELKDISHRVLGHLRSSARTSLATLPADSIIFSRELSSSETAEANIASVNALVTEFGGLTSHAAILARARGTPYVSNISFAHIDPTKHQLVIVDGRTGEVILNPSPKTLEKYEKKYHQLQTHLKNLAQVSRLKAETYDGYAVGLSANIEIASEVDTLHSHGGHNVGLFRSEYIFLDKEKLPNEEEQFKIYRELVEKMKGHSIVIRTFDVGGDKRFPNQPVSNEVNPFLGCRAIRFLLKEREIFLEQLCAILRASKYGDVSVMFPMISTLSELIEAKQVLAEAKKSLAKRGEKIGTVRIGCMIEVPSAAIIADLLAKECDFLSIGTNDLVQYALAVDRGNHALSSLYTPTHPSVIRLIRSVVHEANHHGIPVSVCGEVAADPRFTPLLLGLGVHELSVATRYIPIVKHAIRQTSIVAASRLAEVALSLSTALEIQTLLDTEYKKTVPDDCFYNC